MNASALLLVSAEIPAEKKNRILSLPRITPVQYSYLQAIAKHPGICANRAGRVIGRKHSSSHDLVKALIRMNLVSRQENPFLSSPTGIPLFVTSTGWHLLTVLQEAGL